jgi:hypothetical protein
VGKGSLGNILVRQKWRREFRGLKYPDADAAGYIRTKAGKEYWLPLIDEVRVCRRSNTVWGFEHLCTKSTFNGSSYEMRKSNGEDKYMRCVACQKKFPPRSELVELARATYPDIDTVKFIAGLARLYGD